MLALVVALQVLNMADHDVNGATDAHFLLDGAVHFRSPCEALLGVLDDVDVLADSEVHLVTLRFVAVRSKILQKYSIHILNAPHMYMYMYGTCKCLYC